MRIAVIDRADRTIRWIHTDPFWVWHFANAFDRASDVRRPRDRCGLHRMERTRWHRARWPHHRWRSSGSCSIPPPVRSRADVWSDETAEFSRIDDRLIGAEHRSFVVTNRTSGMPVDEQNVIVRIDTPTGALTRWESGDCGVRRGLLRAHARR